MATAETGPGTLNKSEFFLYLKWLFTALKPLRTV
jgi:hypothetical protein